MITIIDNVGLPSRNNPAVDPWLETLLRKTTALSEADFVLRLESERKPSAIVYKLENNQNKTSASISKRLNTIRVELFRRPLPDPEQCIKPPISLVSAFVFDKTEDGLQAAAQALCDVLAAPNAYSDKEVVRVKVYPNAPPGDPWSFSGGQITGIVNDEKADEWVLVTHSSRYSVAKARLHGRTPKLMQFVVFDGKGGVELVMETEYDFYFESAHA